VTGATGAIGRCFRAERSALVTGATGVIGPRLVQQLIASGYTVRVLVRRPPPAALLPESVEVMIGDITYEDAVAAAVAGTTHVFHLAAKLHINDPDNSLAGQYRRTNVDGARIVAEAARDAGVSRFVFFSSIAVYGPSKPGEVLHEGSPALATSLYGSTKRDAEEMLLSIRRQSDDEPLAVILRLGSVYGSRMKGNYRELVRWLRRGIFVPIGPGDNRRTLVHEEDVADAALLAAVHPAAAGGIYNVTDGDVHTFREIVAVICQVLGRAPPRLHVPIPVARACARALDSGLTLAGRTSRAGSLVEKLLEDMAVDGSRIQEELGFRPRFDLRTGWGATIARLIHD
jgi:nucleoside-diphosphate-sugar epimerase